MNKTNIEKLIDEIKTSNDKRILYKTLVTLRTDIIKDTEGVKLFFACDGIPPIISLLHKPYEKILEVVLSIIGNCCSKKECCFQACDNGLIPALMSILTNISNTNIQTRSARIIGNVAYYPVIANKLQQLGVARKLNMLLDEENVPILIMTIRAIRLLWHNENFRNDILSMDSIMKIVLILVTSYRNKDIDNTQTKPVDVDDENTDDVAVISKKTTCVKLKKYLSNRLTQPVALNTDVLEYKEIIDKPEITMKHDNIFTLPNNTDRQELVMVILKLFDVISVKSSNGILYKLAGDGSGYMCLSFLCKESKYHRKMTLKVLSNIASNTFSRSYLVQADTLKIALYLLSNETLDDAERKYCIKIICLSVYDSCNRSKIRKFGILKKLVEEIKETNCSKQFGIVLYGLYQFRYDELSMELLVANGIVEIFLKKLEELIKEQPLEHSIVSNTNTINIDSHVKLNPKKRSKFDSAPPPKQAKYSNDIYCPDSPGCSSYGSTWQRSPSTSSSNFSPRSLSPQTNIEYESDENSDRYSPVLLEIDSNLQEAIINSLKTNLITEETKFQRILNDDDSLPYISTNVDEIITIDDSEVEENNENNDDESFENETETNIFITNPIKPILIILATIATHDKYTPDLAKPYALTVLVKLLKLVKNITTEISIILCKTVRDYKNFEIIIRQNFIFELNVLRRQMPDHENCKICDAVKGIAINIFQIMNRVGEDCYGRGTLTRFLLSGNESLKKHAAIISAFIIQYPPILHHFLVECNVLNIIMNIILEDENEDLLYQACAALAEIAINLNIAGDIMIDRLCDWEIKTKNSYFKIEDLPNKANGNDTIVTFKVKNNNDIVNLVFSQKTLINNCDVFKSMLTSGFKESKNNEISLTDVCESGLRYFLYIIILKANNNLKNIPLVDDIQMALEAYELSLKYMIPDIESYLLSLIKYLICDKTVLAIFKWSLKNYNQDLLDTTILFFLTATIDNKIRVNIFRDANQCEFSKQWMSLIKEAILFKCSKQQ